MVLAWLTASGAAPELPLYVSSPEYVAWMLCGPTPSDGSTSVAWSPLEPFWTFAVPSVVLPSVNVTVPVGSPVPDVGATVAVAVTCWPYTAVLLLSATVVVDGSSGLCTLNVTVGDELGAKFASPL